jgi:hypothetical protein
MWAEASEEVDAAPLSITSVLEAPPRRWDEVQTASCLSYVSNEFFSQEIPSPSALEYFTDACPLTSSSSSCSSSSDSQPLSSLPTIQCTFARGLSMSLPLLSESLWRLLLPFLSGSIGNHSCHYCCQCFLFSIRKADHFLILVIPYTLSSPIT